LPLVCVCVRARALCMHTLYPLLTR
jgi:hypothetical protein